MVVVVVVPGPVQLMVGVSYMGVGGEGGGSGGGGGGGGCCSPLCTPGAGVVGGGCWVVVGGDNGGSSATAECHGLLATISRMVTHHQKSTRRKCTTDF